MRELRLYEVRKSKPFILDVALEYKRMIACPARGGDSGKVTCQAELARKLGLSRARITQVLNVLKINPGIFLKLSSENLIEGVTERRLRNSHIHNKITEKAPVLNN
ncbi:hypothetical protein ACFL7D_05535 [candidate division KSB1 bacterium]